MLTFVSWFGTLTSIFGSFAVATKWFQIGYILFTFGSLAWLWVAYQKKDKALGVLNGTFFVANVIGLFNFF
jgi:hypothetical protein